MTTLKDAIFSQQMLNSHLCPPAGLICVNHGIVFVSVLLAKWWAVHGDPVSGDDAWDLSWDEISLWNELRPSWPGCTKHSGQQQLGV